MLQQKIFNCIPAVGMVACLAAAIVLGSVGTSFAGFVYLASDNSVGESWLTAGDWSPSGAPSSGNDYHVGWNGTSYSDKSLRSPDLASATFGGDSLTLYGSGDDLGILNLKGGDGKTVTVGNLRLNGGLVAATTAGSSADTLAGIVTVNSASKFDPLWDDQTLVLSALLTGSGDLELSMNYAGTNYTGILQLANSSNTYAGDWTVTRGKLWASASDSLGSGDITVGTNGKIDVDYDHYNADATFTLDGLMTLDTGEDHTFKAITIAGTALSVGAHSFNDLNTSFDANFVNGGGGTLTVIPEPSTLVLLALGALSLLLWRWRRRK